MSAPSIVDKELWQPHRLLQAAARQELLVLPSDEMSWTKFAVLLYRPTGTITPRLVTDDERRVLLEMAATDTLATPSLWPLGWCTWEDVVRLAHLVVPSAAGFDTLRRWNGYRPLTADGGLR